MFSTPTAEESDIMIQTLGPIEEVTCELSSRSHASSSVTELKVKLQAEGPTTRRIKTLQESMLQSLERQFAKMKDTKCLMLATLLVPR